MTVIKSLFKSIRVSAFPLFFNLLLEQQNHDRRAQTCGNEGNKVAKADQNR